MTPAKTITVPTFPRVDDFAGAWLIEPAAGQALWERVSRLDMAAHVAQAAPRPLESTMEKIAVDGGKSIAVVKLQGLMTKGNNSLGGTSTTQARRDIRQATADPTVQAILLAVDSPGGSASGSEALANDVRDANRVKPVVAQVDDIAASAALFAIAGSSKIFASNRSSQVGSIGTMLMVTDSSQAAAKEGVIVHTFATGSLKGAGAPGTPVTAAHGEYFAKIVNDLQVPFSDAVQAGRRLNPSQLAAVTSGAIFTAEEAQRLGLIDGIQSLETTVAQLQGRGNSNLFAGAPGKGTFTMNFETYCQARGFDVATLSDVQRNALKADFQANQRTPIARPINGNLDGASLMGDLDGAELQAVCEQLGNPQVEFRGVTQSAYEHAVQHGLGVADARKLIGLAKLRDSRPIHSGIAIGPRFGGSSQDVLEVALLQRAGHERVAVAAYGERALEVADRSIHDKSFLGLCRQALAIDGRDIPHTTNGILQAAFSTISLPNALANTLGRTLDQAYNDTPASWRLFAKINSAANFKPQSAIRPSFVGNLEPLAADGEIEHGTLAESVLPWSIDTYAKMLGLTRKDIIDDDLSFLSEAGPLMGRAAARTLNDLVWKTILANAGPHFVAGNNNYLTTGSALSATSLGLALTAMRSQLDAQGRNIDIVPKVLVVPPALENLARTILASEFINAAAGSATGNSLRGVVELIVEPRLSNTAFPGYSAAAWYLFASPADAPIIVGYLDGRQTPVIEVQDADFNTLGIQIRCFHDFGVALGDPRAGVKATGAA